MMPILNVSVAGKPDLARSAAIATLLTELTRAHLKKDPLVTAVAINYIEPEHWFVGGRSLASQATSSFWLDIKVTSGTNTKVQLAAYLEAVFTEMSKLLSSVHEDSYIVVHEVPASAWGFSGKSQEFRYVASILEIAA
jgi:4-oxalocrotonate tautomerase